MTVLQQTLEKSLAPKLKTRSKITPAFCPFCGDNHNQVDCESWTARVEEEDRRLERVEFSGRVDVEPLEIDEEVAVEAEKRFVVRLPVAVVESMAGALVAENVAIVEVVAKGKAVVVVAEEVEGGVGSHEGD
ncbi:hypothetical protein HOY80DRAFT_1043081 [Tuber brumale]|nr:hypothetical protein HOY80DRAFT_1043081 [Tuber brumale]